MGQVLNGVDLIEGVNYGKFHNIMMDSFIWAWEKKMAIAKKNVGQGNGQMRQLFPRSSIA